MKRSILALFCLLMLLIWPCLSSAQTKPATLLQIDPAFERQYLGLYLEVLRDPTGQLTVEQVSSSPLAREFKLHTSPSLHYGFDRAAYWFRFRINKIEADRVGRPLVLGATRPAIEVLDIFLPQGKGSGLQYRHLRAGMARFGRGDSLGHRFPAVEIPADFKSEEYIYVRVKTQVVYYALILFTNKSFDSYCRFEYLFFGITSGIMLAMMLYNLTIAFFLRDKIYFAYCIYIVFVNIYVSLLSGWPVGLGFDPNWMISIILHFFASTFFFGILFSKLFLLPRGHRGLFDRVFKILMLLAVIVFFLSMVDWNAANKISYLLGFISPVFIIICAAWRWRQGFLPARYYLLAWGVLLLSTMGYAASGLALLDYSFVVNNFPTIGAATESILLSFALADRIRTLQQERLHLREQERRLTELSITDELTGLYNKRWFSSKLMSEMDHTKRLGNPMSLILLDVDHFKKFNDTFGHAAGDKVLAILGQVINLTIRKDDVPCRYGGEEFAIILPSTGKQEAMAVAERLRQGFSDRKIMTPQQGWVGATISLGVTQLAGGDDPDSMFERCDHALYQAKSQGRDRVMAL